MKWLGLLYYILNQRPSVFVSNKGSKDNEVASDVKVNNGSSKNCLLVESLIDRSALYDTEEYELLFEEVECYNWFVIM